MTIVNASWLYKNDTRKYPCYDVSPIVPNAIADLSVSFPRTLGVSTRVYIDSVIVSPNVASVGISLEGYINAEGTARIAQAVVQSPEAFRLYPLTSGDSRIFGFVVFGSAALPGRTAVSQSFTDAEGELLESVVLRYDPGVSSGFQVGSTFMAGDITMIGEGGLVAEVVPVYFDDIKATEDALVFRLERNLTAMLAPVATCDMPTEAGTRTDLVTSINGVCPNTNGTINLVFSSMFDFKYDSLGDIEFDANNKPLYDPTKPLVRMEPGVLGEMVFLDNFDYSIFCQSKNRRLQIVSSSSLCNNCTTQNDGECTGLDLSDGLPIVMGGAVVWSDKLCVYWGFSAQGIPAFGQNPLGVTLTMTDPTAAPVTLMGTLRIVGFPPRFPGDLKPGTLIPGCGAGAAPSSVCYGSLGEPVYSVYQLSRPLTKGEAFQIEGTFSVVKNTPPVWPPNYPVYHSAPFDDPCVRYARDPDSEATIEFQGL
jgi:hypothetical protein